MTFYHPNDEGGMAWNDPEIGVKWPQVKGDSIRELHLQKDMNLEDGTKLNLSEKDQKWAGLKNIFKF